MPDRVARWFGQGGQNLNEENYSRNAIALLNNQAKQRTQQAAGGAANGMQRNQFGNQADKANDASQGAQDQPSARGRRE